MIKLIAKETGEKRDYKIGNNLTVEMTGEFGLVASQLGHLLFVIWKSDLDIILKAKNILDHLIEAER